MKAKTMTQPNHMTLCPPARQSRLKRAAAKHRQREAEPNQPVLRFTPTAWAKLQFFCHHGDTEIGGLGITSAEDPLFIEEFATIQQSVTAVSVAFDDAAVADFFESQVDAGRKPEQFARLWLHTHPMNSATPSMVDEETFDRVFGRCDWAVMFILACGGETYARLRWNVGPGGQLLIPVGVEYANPFGGSDHAGWQDEYERHIQVSQLSVFDGPEEAFDELGPTGQFWDDRELSDERSASADLETCDDFPPFDPNESEVEPC